MFAEVYFCQNATHMLSNMDIMSCNFDQETLRQIYFSYRCDPDRIRNPNKSSILGMSAYLKTFPLKWVNFEAL